MNWGIGTFLFIIKWSNWHAEVADVYVDVSHNEQFFNELMNELILFWGFSKADFMVHKFKGRQFFCAKLNDTDI